MRIKTFVKGGYIDGGFTTGGGTMTGPLILAGDPVKALEAVTKQYADQKLTNFDAGKFTSGTLQVGRLPAFTGDVVSTTGTNSLSLVDTGVGGGAYAKVTVNAKGLVTAGSGLAETDLPDLTWSKITSDKPTTVSGFGITDALTKSGGTVTGSLTLHADPTNANHIATKQYVDNKSSGGTALKTGDIITKMSNVTPAGFLRCNGGIFSKTTYPALYSAISQDYMVTSTLDYTSYLAMGAGAPWKQQYDINSLQSGDLSDWTNPGNLPIALFGSQALLTKDRVYLLGGCNNVGTPISTIYTAPINSDGTLGTWTTAGDIPANIYRGVSFVTKNRVYLANNGTNLHTAPINADGTLGAWTTQTSVFPASVARAQAIVTKSRVYIVANGTTTVYYAPINTDGTVGAWTTQTNALPEGLLESQVVATKNRVYLLGGTSLGATVYAILTAPVNSDGSIGTWVWDSSLPDDLRSARAVVTKNTVYLLGGASDGPGFLSTVHKASINADGTLGTWTTGTALPSALSEMEVIIVKNKIYTLGGIANGGITSGQIYSATFNSSLNDYSLLINGTINKFDGSDISGTILLKEGYSELFTATQPGNGKPWVQQYAINTEQTNNITGWSSSAALQENTSNAQAIVTKNRVYLLGGYSSTSGYLAGIQSAPINADGTLGAWINDGGLPTTLSEAQAIVTKNRVYILGGYNINGPRSATYTAPINSDGTLGTWTSGTNLAHSLSGSQAIVTKDRVYLIGGAVNGSYSSVVSTAPINADGTIGTWTATTSLPQSVAFSQAVVTKSRVYLLGGIVNNTYSSTVYTAPINSDGTLGTWTQDSNSLPVMSVFSQAVVTKNRVYLIGGDNSSMTSAVYTAPINADGTIGTWTTGTSLPGKLGQSQAIMTKSRIYMIGGHNGGGNTSVVYTASIVGGLNDYTPYYNGSIVAVSSSDFKLPDLTTVDLPGTYSYIKT